MHLTTPIPEQRLLRIRGRARAGSEPPISAKVQAYLRGEPSMVPPASERLDEGKEERRRYYRVALHSEIVVRRVGGFNFQVAMKDVSSGGCRVEMIEPCGTGDTLIARFPELEPLGSRVCWSSGSITGVQFSTAIHPAVLQALLARLPAEPKA
jgi:hypothetical protein